MIKFLSSKGPMASIFLACASSCTTVVCLFLLFILTFWGTVAQVQQGLYAAQERFFNSFFFLAAGFIPFPGAQLVLWVLFINLVSMMVLTFKKFTQWENLGLLIIHVGLILYFVAAFLTFHAYQESSIRLAEGESTHIAISSKANKATPVILPFTIRLEHFTAKFHPGTEVAKSYESVVTITTGPLQRQVRIYMNNPLRYKDYTVYQASYDTDGMGHEHSIFAVVKNYARILPYIACLLVFFGLVLHFLMKALMAKVKV